MKTKLKLFQARLFCAVALGIGSSVSLAAAARDSADPAPAKTTQAERGHSCPQQRIAREVHNKFQLAGASEGAADRNVRAPLTNHAIPWSQIGAKAAADYQGDGLAISPTAEGARLRCVFQRLEGEATREGLWLTSTVTNGVNDRFRVTAAEVGRVTPSAPSQRAGEMRNLEAGGGAHGVTCPTVPLPNHGTVSIDGQTARLTRPGLVEEYSVSMDGVQQALVVLERPTGVGELAVRLDVSGARVEPAAFGAQLVLENSGRKIAYSRLRVTDATGKELTARMEVRSAGGEVTSLKSEEGSQVGRVTPCAPMPAATDNSSETRNGAHGVTRPTAPTLLVLVNDADAVYPIRIDPTFSDANWSSMGGVPGTDGQVSAAVLDGAGNLYIGGNFSVAGDVFANGIAKWDGNNWSALGSGMGGGLPSTYVFALAVSGTDLYAAGNFTNAGGSAANNIAKWDGSNWSALGSGFNGGAAVLALSGSDLYAGGSFTNAGGNTANHIAKWNGSSWSTLGSGMNDVVRVLAVSGSDLYAGGNFTNAGGSAATNIAKWDGSSWSALGSGMDGDYPYVRALAVSGGDLYAGGYFTTAGGSAANSIAKWNGSIWSALGSGIGGDGISALAVSGGNVYAGGQFSPSLGALANNIAKWDGSNWSALGLVGSGLNDRVYALATTGSDVYAGGRFTKAGGSTAYGIAHWNGSSWSALGSGVNYPVYALVVSGSNVYAGGDFTMAGGIAANGIAKWDGSSWTALGSGMFGGFSGYALAVSGNDVYAVNGAYVAKWNGSWSNLGSPFNLNGVSALAVSGSNVYAGGIFSTAGGSPAKAIAKWDGSSWSALGSGAGGDDYPYVFALAVSGNDLYAGGGFTTAGGKSSAYIARAYLPTLPTLSVLRSGTDVMVSWPSADTAGFALQHAAALAPSATWVTNTASITDDGTNKSLTLPATNNSQFFRLRRP